MIDIIVRVDRWYSGLSPSECIVDGPPAWVVIDSRDEFKTDLYVEYMLTRQDIAIGALDRKDKDEWTVVPEDELPDEVHVAIMKLALLGDDADG